eukprot:617368-Rhodomonas_salina.1
MGAARGYSACAKRLVATWPFGTRSWLYGLCFRWTNQRASPGVRRRQCGEEHEHEKGARTCTAK